MRWDVALPLGVFVCMCMFMGLSVCICIFKGLCVCVCVCLGEYVYIHTDR